MQIVYLSNRPQTFKITLKVVAVFMPFINEAVVCVPNDRIFEFGGDDIALPCKAIDEKEILSTREHATLTNLDHQSRNYFLRARLIESGLIKSTFLMSDDDYRPLRHMTEEVFLENSKYHRYFFHDLMRWNNNRTEFDLGQIATGAVLSQHDLPCLSYASHMPQIIDRELFLESVRYFEHLRSKFPLCEWSTYFNYASRSYPDRFHEPKPYATLCWPEHPLAWKPGVDRSELLFENFTPDLYRKGKVFNGLNRSPESAEQAIRINIEKIMRWRQHTIDSIHPEQGTSPFKYLNWRTWVNKVLNHTRI